MNFFLTICDINPLILLPGCAIRWGLQIMEFVLFVAVPSNAIAVNSDI